MYFFLLRNTCSNIGTFVGVQNVIVIDYKETIHAPKKQRS